MSPNTVDHPLDVHSSDEDVMKDTLDELKKFMAGDEKKNNVENKKWLFIRRDLLLRHTIFMIVLHAIGISSLCSGEIIFEKWKTLLWTLLVGVWSGFGVTAGAHRLWTHKSYKATLPLNILLAISYLTAGQYSIKLWIRDHRLHHKYAETDADPHNSKRGFFFSHIGWLMLKRHPEYTKRAKQIDLSDVDNDPVLSITAKYFFPLTALFCYILPTFVPVYFWNESFLWTLRAQIVRHMIQLHCSFCVNSFAHFFGTKPYDQNIAAVDSEFVSYVSFGEGWHNYHHTFPSDYRAAEFGDTHNSLTTRFIHLFGKLGWAYDFKSPSKSLIEMTIAKRGDGSHSKAKNIEDTSCN